MKLQEIMNSAPAWQTLSALKKNPKLAYRLLKYEKKVQRECDLCLKQRDLLIFEVAGVEPPPPGEQKIIQLGADTPQYASFFEKYNAFLQTESDLEGIGMSMDELVEGLGAQVGNALAEGDLQLLEPFFMEAAPSA